MKKNHLNGQVLSEKEMKEVKGGAWYIVKNPPTLWKCEECGYDIEYYLYNGELYCAVCENCGCRKEFKVEE